MHVNELRPLPGARQRARRGRRRAPAAGTGDRTTVRFRTTRALVGPGAPAPERASDDRGGGRRRRGRGHPQHHGRPGRRVRQRRDERERRGTRRRGEADRGEDGERERPPCRVGLRHEQALGRDRAELRLEERSLPNRGAAAHRIDGDHRHDGDRQRSRFLDGHESRRRSGRAARSCSSTPTARRPATEQSLKPRRLRADETLSCRI